MIRRYPGQVTHRVLIAEDDNAVRRSIERALKFEGYEVATAENGERALVEAAKVPPDAIVLDIMMPILDGMAVCRKIRAAGDSTPILMLTAKHELADRVAGLDAGADDYLVKPFALEELLARVRALLRRRELPADSGILQIADLSLDPAARTVRRGSRLVDLTKTEFDLLELLLMNSGIVLSRDTIYDRIWGFDFATSSNSLDVYVGYLRRKTEADDEPRLIQTVRGVGYVAREQ
jgi:two-component system response regulator MprA